MHRNLNYTKDFLKEISKQPPKHFSQVVTKILALNHDGLPSDCKQLHGHTGLCRIDSGEYRIVYRLSAETVEIIIVGKRNDDEVYRLLERKL